MEIQPELGSRFEAQIKKDKQSVTFVVRILPKLGQAAGDDMDRREFRTCEAAMAFMQSEYKLQTGRDLPQETKEDRGRALN